MTGRLCFLPTFLTNHHPVPMRTWALWETTRCCGYTSCLVIMNGEHIVLAFQRIVIYLTSGSQNVTMFLCHQGPYINEWAVSTVRSYTCEETVMCIDGPIIMIAIKQQKANSGFQITFWLVISSLLVLFSLLILLRIILRNKMASFIH